MSSQQVADEQRVQPAQRRSKRIVVVLVLVLLMAVAGVAATLLLLPDSSPPGGMSDEEVEVKRTPAPRASEDQPAAGQQDAGPLAITATSAQAEHPPDHAVDEDRDTRWAPTEAEASITFDIGREVTLRGVEIAWYQGLGRQTSFEILASTDGEDWSELHVGTSSGTQSRPETIELTAAPVRYLRIALTAGGDGTAGISHVRLDADETVPPQLARTTRQEQSGEPAPDPASLGADVLVDADFDGLDGGGGMTAGMLREAFESHGAVVPNAESKLDGMAVADDPAGPGRVLAVTVLARKLSGMNFSVNLDEGPGFEEAYLSYRVKFEEGFDFKPYGGKLPGLAGGPNGDHGQKRFPAGCEKVTGKNGFSERGMWVSWMEETDGQPALDQYIYHKNQSSDCGDSYLYEGVTGMPVLEAGRWYHIQHRVRMNDPGRSNGVVEAWLDGEPVLSMSDLEFRDDDSWGINVLYMATFFGGNDRRWKHDQDETIYLDDFVVHGVDPIAG